MLNISQTITDYLALLAKWNKAYNLTAITDPEMITVLNILEPNSLESIISILDAFGKLPISTSSTQRIRKSLKFSLSNFIFSTKERSIRSWKAKLLDYSLGQC